MTDVEIACPVFCEEDIEAILCFAADFAIKSEKKSGSVSMIVMDNEAIHGLNREYRNIDRPTDVLSFPSGEGEELIAPPDGFLGDIAISLERAEEQAEEYGHSLTRELSFLTIHGVLHLLGYDHIEEEDRAVMERRQKEILDEMGITR